MWRNQSYLAGQPHLIIEVDLSAMRDAQRNISESYVGTMKKDFCSATKQCAKSIQLLGFWFFGSVS